MTTTERRAALAACWLSQRMFAEIIGEPEGRVRAWFRGDGGDMPGEVEAWLARRAAASAEAMRADPPPVATGATP